MQRLMAITDNAFSTQAIRQALRHASGFQIVGFFNGRDSIQDQLVELRPDVVLIDDMYEPDRALARLCDTRKEAPDAKSIMLVVQMDNDFLDAAFSAGAHTVISKAVHPVALGCLLREISRGNVVQRSTKRPSASSEPCPLTGRELEIMRHVAQGKTNGQIARELWLTEQTVKFHLGNTYKKLGVANRTEATRYAYDHGFLTETANAA